VPSRPGPNVCRAPSHNSGLPDGQMGNSEVALIPIARSSIAAGVGHLRVAPFAAAVAADFGRLYELVCFTPVIGGFDVSLSYRAEPAGMPDYVGVGVIQ
jgi:hypothetical protein